MTPWGMPRLLVQGGLLVAGLTGASHAQEGATRDLTGVVLRYASVQVPAVVYVPAVDSIPTTPDREVDQRQLSYVPVVTVVTPGSPVAFRNSDPLVHNVFSPTRATGRFDLGRYGPNEVRTHPFLTTGVALILCRIHPEMFAYVAVLRTRHWTTTGQQGQFRLSVPADTDELIVWHPSVGERRVRLPRPGERLVIDLGADGS